MKAASAMSDDQAFEQLVRRHGPRLLAVTRRLLRHEGEAGAALQEAFVRASSVLSTVLEEADLASRLHGIAVEAALRRLDLGPDLGGDAVDALLPAFLADGHHARHPHAWTLPDPGEARRCVRTALDRLPAALRVVLLLRDVEGLGTAEVARCLGVTDNLVKLRLHQARQVLRAALEPRFEQEN